MRSYKPVIVQSMLMLIIGVVTGNLLSYKLSVCFFKDSVIEAIKSFSLITILRIFSRNAVITFIAFVLGVSSARLLQVYLSAIMLLLGLSIGFGLAPIELQLCSTLPHGWLEVTGILVAGYAGVRRRILYLVIALICIAFSAILETYLTPLVCYIVVKAIC